MNLAYKLFINLLIPLLHVDYSNWVQAQPNMNLGFDIINCEDWDSKAKAHETTLICVFKTA